MNRLEYYSRPLVAFDARNKEHRRYYYQFIQKRSWGFCPVRFICPEATGSDLVKMIQTELLNYYVGKEFNSPAPSSDVHPPMFDSSNSKPKRPKRQPKSTKQNG